MKKSMIKTKNHNGPVCFLHDRFIMSEIEESLLRGKKQSKQYKKRFGDCQNRIRALRNKNNELQKQCDNDLASDIRKAINQQSKFVSAEITAIKKIIEDLNKDYNDPPSKNKIKDLWEKCAKEVQRNKRIMQDFVNRASQSVMRSTLRVSKSQMDQPVGKPETKEEIKHQQSLLVSDYLDSQVVFQQKMISQRNKLIQELQQKNQNINKIMNQMGQMIGGQQRQHLQHIEAHTNQAYMNLRQANQQLDQAQNYSRKSKKKYFIIVAIILIALIAAAGVIFLLLR